MKRVTALCFILMLSFVSGCYSTQIHNSELLDTKNHIAQDLFEEENIPDNTIRQNKNIKASPKPSADIVYITRTGIKYHKYGCRYLNKSQIESTLDDAVSNGYEPCLRCIK